MLWEKVVLQLPGEAGHVLWMHDDGHISMKGREIFNFCMLSVSGQLAECLKKNRLNPDEIDCLVLHQASRYIVEALGRKAGFSSEKPPLYWVTLETVFHLPFL